MTPSPDEPQATAEPPAADHERGGGRLLLRWLGRVALAIVVVVGMLSLVPAPYTVIAADDPIDARALLERPSPPRDAAAGDGALLIPALDVHDARWSEVLWYRLTGGATLEPRRKATEAEREALRDHGNVDPEVLHRDSFALATLLAARAAGVPARIEGDGVRVGADKLLRDSELDSGDVVVEYAGEPISTFDDLVATVRRQQAGEELRATLDDGRTAQLPPLEQWVLDGLPITAPAALGVNSVETVDPEVHGTPIEWSRTEGVEGTSSGLALALAAYERLDGEALAPDQVVYATGELSSDGHVYSVAGVPEKTSAAREGGADLIIVSRQDSDVARQHAGSLRVVAVDTVTEAVEALDD